MNKPCYLEAWTMKVSYLLVLFDSDKLNLRCWQASANARTQYSMFFKLSKQGDDEEATQHVKWKLWAMSWSRCTPILSLIWVFWTVCTNRGMYADLNQVRRIKTQLQRCSWYFSFFSPLRGSTMSCPSTQLIFRLLLGLKREIFLFFSYGASDTQNYFPFFLIILLFH